MLSQLMFLCLGVMIRLSSSDKYSLFDVLTAGACITGLILAGESLKGAILKCPISITQPLAIFTHTECSA
jgi:hypothetical protein